MPIRHTPWFNMLLFHEGASEFRYYDNRGHYTDSGEDYADKSKFVTSRPRQH
jgi:hypothetical protein